MPFLAKTLVYKTVQVFSEYTIDTINADVELFYTKVPSECVLNVARSVLS